MKKILLLFMLFSISSFGQTKEERQAVLDAKKGGRYNSRDSLNYPPRFCLVLATGRMFTKKVDISIDYGQESRFFEDTSVRDGAGKLITFHSVVDALNYMKHLGWEFRDAYAISVGSQNVYHFLFEYLGDTTKDYLPKIKRDIEE